jgi:hypothetical protein
MVVQLVPAERKEYWNNFWVPPILAVYHVSRLVFGRNYESPVGMKQTYPQVRVSSQATGGAPDLLDTFGGEFRDKS